MSEETIMGSDGVSRTLDGWYWDILEKISLSNGESSVDIAGAKLNHHVKDAWMCKVKGLTPLMRVGCPDAESPEYHYLDIKNQIGELAREHFISILEDSISESLSASKPSNLGDVLESLSDKIKLLSRRCMWDEGKKRPKLAMLGWCILAYIDQNESLPSSRQELEEFSKKISKHVPIRTIAEYLPWFHLEDVCRGNEKM